MMTDKKNNHKLSCVGLDDDEQPARMIFFVYGVESVEDARNEVRKDNIRRKMMRQNNVDWKSVELHALRCNAKGEVAESDLEQELGIMAIEADQLEALFRQNRMRPWMEDTDEREEL